MLRLVSFTDNEDGWGRQARCLSKALNRYERTELVGWGFRRPGPLRSLWRRWSGLHGSDLVTISLGSPERARFLSGNYRIVYFVGETTRIPGAQMGHLESADMVWTPSRWGRRVLEANGVPPAKLRSVPEGVDTTVFVPPIERPRHDAVFRFLCVGKWEERKGTADLVQSFLQEFDSAEPVELIMHCGSPIPRRLDYRERLAQQLAGSEDRKARIVASDPLGLHDFVRLMQRSDAFVLPTRGEGWGLPVLEAMACGLPCIVTGYSGLTEFAHEHNCYPIRVERMRPVSDPEFFDPRYEWGEWAQPDLGHLRALMRHVYENREEARAKAARARAEAEELWTWDRAAQVAMSHIQELRAARG